MRYQQMNNKSGGSKGNITAIALIAMAGIIIGFFAISFSKEQTKSSAINKENFCANNLEKLTVIIIDATDKLSLIQKASLKTRLWEIANNLEKNTHKIQIYSVDKIINKILEPSIDLCNPGSAENANQLTENKKIIQKRYEEKFKKNLDIILDNVLNRDSLNQSPIMESIQSVAITSFIPLNNKAINKKLILVTDLLQNTPKFSAYKSNYNFSQYKDSEHYKHVKSDLENVDVELFFLHRENTGKIQTPQLRDFWMEFFSSQGANVSRFLPIEG
ncbi:MAG: hypothetical protein ACO201_00915 [Rickettsiales bacterium]